LNPVLGPLGGEHLEWHGGVAPILEQIATQLDVPGVNLPGIALHQRRYYRFLPRFFDLTTPL
jgi:hypothetical protein